MLHEFVNKNAPAGTSLCKMVAMKQGAMLRVVCKDSVIDLNAAAQGEVKVTLIASDRYCSKCTSAVTDEAGRFIAKNCAAPATCE